MASRDKANAYIERIREKKLPVVVAAKML